MNYLFDLYGTLIDIRTDETIPALWRVLADLYRRYGAVWQPKELHSRFLETEAALRAETARERNTAWPEIRLERVFAQLYLEKAADPSMIRDREAWLYGIANTFRAVSIRHIRLFPGVLPMLRRLKERGDRVFLLSNAQRIFTLPEIRGFGLLPFFDAVYLSSDHDLCKPDPRFMEKLLREQGLDREQTVMVGNDPGCDLGIAARCGVRGILFNSWGLTRDKIPPALEKAAGREKAGTLLRDLRVITGWTEL